MERTCNENVSRPDTASSGGDIDRCHLLPRPPGLSPAQPIDWQPATPASQGVSDPKLDALRDEMGKRRTRAFLVIRNDKIVCEWYAPGASVAP